MKLANATNLHRKSGVAQRRDLQFALMEKRNPEQFTHAHSLVPESETADPSAALRFGPNDKRVGEAW